MSFMQALDSTFTSRCYYGGTAFSSWGGTKRTVGLAALENMRRRVKEDSCNMCRIVMAHGVVFQLPRSSKAYYNYPLGTKRTIYILHMAQLNLGTALRRHLKLVDSVTIRL